MLEGLLAGALSVQRPGSESSIIAVKRDEATEGAVRTWRTLYVRLTSLNFVPEVRLEMLVDKVEGE